MTQEQAKELLPIIQAFAEGKMIQDKIEGLTDWCDTDEINFQYEGQKIKHRIKPESKYRPFRDKEECWDEMHKHPDFGWIKYKETGTYIMVSIVYSSTTIEPPHISIDCCEYTSNDAFNNLCFTDGKPFGVEEK